MSALTVAEVLDGAADLLEKPGAWTQGGYFVKEGKALLCGEGATCFCMVGALTVAAGKERPVEIENGPVGKFLKSTMFDRIGFLHRWNDDPGRTQAEVVAKLREAATLAREGRA